MRARSIALGVAALGAACVEGTAPTHQTTLVLMDFCQDQIPSFFAYQNDGSLTWVGVTPTADGSVAFNATEKIGIATIFLSASAALTDVYFTTLTELQPLLTQQCTERFGTKNVNGSVANVSSSSEAIVSMSGASVLVPPAATAFQLTGIASGPQDLVAQREGIAGNTIIPDRIIVRRSANIISGGTMSVLDFAASEAQQPASNTATVTGLASGESNFLDVNFMTASGTHHSLYSPPSYSVGTQTVFGIPAALTQSGDLHRLTLESDAASGSSYRGLDRLYRTPLDLTVTLGAALATPQYSSLGTNPVRLRMQLAVQSDYSSFVTASYGQGGAITKSWYVTVTAAYFSTPPTTWSVDMPDLSSAGAPTSGNLASGVTTTRIVEAYGGNLANFIGERPADGATVRFGGNISTGTSVRLDESGSAGPRSRIGPLPARPTFGSKR